MANERPSREWLDEAMELLGFNDTTPLDDDQFADIMKQVDKLDNNDEEYDAKVLEILREVRDDNGCDNDDW